MWVISFGADFCFEQIDMLFIHDNRFRLYIIFVFDFLSVRFYSMFGRNNRILLKIHRKLSCYYEVFISFECFNNFYNIFTTPDFLIWLLWIQVCRSLTIREQHRRIIPRIKNLFFVSYQKTVSIKLVLVQLRLNY